MRFTNSICVWLLRWARVAATFAGLMGAAAISWLPLTAQAQPPSGRITRPVTAGRVPPLVRETAVQFEIAYWRHPAEQALRRQQLDAVVAAWRAGARSEANSRRLEEWLRAAIRNSMPGSQEQLPPPPEFDLPAEVSRVAPNVPSAVNRGRRSAAGPITITAGTSTAANAIEPTLTKRSMLTAAEKDKSESQTAAAASSTAKADERSATDDDFWTDHPANSDLPEDLATGDPFRDDP